MIDINQSPVLCPHTSRIFSPIFGQTISIADHFDSLCTAIEAHKKDAMTKLVSLLWLGKNLRRRVVHFTLKKN